MHSQQLIDQITFLTLEIEQSHSNNNEELKLLLENSLEAIQEAIVGLKQKNHSIYKPWFLKCNEYIDYVKLHRALSDDRNLSPD